MKKHPYLCLLEKKSFISMALLSMSYAHVPFSITAVVFAIFFLPYGCHLSTPIVLL